MRATFLALAAYYAVFYGFLGCWMPYFGLVFKGEGFSDAQIALLAGVVPAARAALTGLWGRVADRLAEPILQSIFTMLASLVCFAPLLWLRGFEAVFACFALFAVFHVGSLPAVEVRALAPAANGRPLAYGKVRLFGSLGFVACVIVLGQLGEVWLRRGLVPVCLGLLVLGVPPLLALRTGNRAPPKARPSVFGFVMRRPRVLAFLFAGTCMQASHAAYYAYYSLYVRELGYSDAVVGMLWALGVLAEIWLFLRVDRWLRRVGLWPALALSFVAACLRWACLAQLEHAVWLCALQLLHALSFGSYHVASIKAARRMFPAGLQVSGQSIYQAAGFGLGAILGQLLNSVWVGSLGYRGMFLVCSLLAGLGFAVVLPVRKLLQSDDGSLA